MSKFFKGMDISSLPEYFDSQEVFYDASGKAMDPFALAVANGINSIRLRIWNDPTQYEEAKGYCDLAHTLAMAKKIKANGLHFMLDFHYSDYWADPGQQRKPKAWENLSFPQLTEALYNYTKEVLLALQEIDCLPDMVQVGNEIRSGMLFPDGAVPNYQALTQLLNAGIKACRDVSPNIKVMIHLDQGGRFYYLKEWFDAVFAAGLSPIDAIGISFYSFWHGTFMDLRDSMRQLISTYNLPVYVVETAHPWRICPTGHVFEDIMETAGLKAGIKEQEQSLALVMQIAASVSKELDTGVYYWEPLCIPGSIHGSWAENMGMLDEKGQALPSFQSYKNFDASHIFSISEDATTSVYDMSIANASQLDTYMEKLYEADESKLPPAGTNLVTNGDFSQGTKGFWLEKDPATVEVREEENAIYVSSKENFTFQLYRDVSIPKAGSYLFSVDYRGTNTTGVHVTMFAKVITCNGEEKYEKEIFPSDVRFVTHSLPPMELVPGTIQLGIRIDAPPVFGRIAAIRLIEC